MFCREINENNFNWQWWCIVLMANPSFRAESLNLSSGSMKHGLIIIRYL